LSPGRRTNRKNLRNCQRTILVLLLLEFSSIKNLHLQDAYFQWSAGRPQAGDRILCSLASRSRAEGKRGAGFALFGIGCLERANFRGRGGAVKIRRKRRWAGVSGPGEERGRGTVIGKRAKRAISASQRAPFDALRLLRAGSKTLRAARLDSSRRKKRLFGMTIKLCRLGNSACLYEHRQ
jgi:hypothetical protein